MAFYVINRRGDSQEVYALVGGLEAWEKQGYPIREGTAEP